MKRSIIISLVILVSIILINCYKEPKKEYIQLPKVSEPIQITHGPHEHFFASYYGINSWSKTQQYATVLETDIKDRTPSEDEPATLGLVNMKTKAFIPLTKTRTWNFQQGCMAHWLGTSPDSLIIFNDLRNGSFVSVIMNVHNKQEIRKFSFPISGVSHEGKKAASINFARLYLTRGGSYGYGGRGQDPFEDEPFPENDGLFLVDLQTGEKELLVSYAEIKELVPEIPEDHLEYFNCTLFSDDGSKIMWLARAFSKKNPSRFINTTFFTVNRDGSNLQKCFPEGWGGSHFDWLNGDTLMITALYDRKQFGHVMFTAGEQDYKLLGKGLLDYDGHGTFSPNEKWIVTDSYPNKLNEQKLFLMDMETEAVLQLGRFYQPPEFKDEWRCDLHARWSPNSDMIGFNSTHTGSRQVYVIKLLNK